MSFNDLDKQVIQLDLCSRCGTCAAVCPVENIYFPDLKGRCLPEDKGHCKEGCMLCSRVCPGNDSDMSSFSDGVILGIENGFGLGPYREIFLAHATDSDIRGNSTSGGAVTALLFYLLENQIVDGVLNVGPDPNDPRLSVSRISHNTDEIMECIQSRYCVVPLNAMLRKLDPNKKYAMVGLPCQIEGFLKLRKCKPSLAERVSILLGLFCHSTMYFEATEHLLESGFQNGGTNINAIRYRDGGFPGHFTVYNGNVSENIAHLDQLMVYFDYFSLNRCRLCLDHVAAFADLSFADPFPFLRELPEDDQKWTAVVTRTEKGTSLLKSALSDTRYLTRREVEVEEVHVQRWDRGLRSKQWVHVLQAASDKRLGISVPDFHVDLPSVGLIKAILNTLKYRIFFNISLGSIEMIKYALRRDSRKKALKQFKKWRRKRNLSKIVEGNG